MKSRAIIFSAPMVLAILAGEKTQTRRLVKPQPHAGMRWDPVATNGYAGWTDGHGAPIRCPYGVTGDRLWVRESFLLDPDANADAWDTAPLPYISWADSRTPSLLPEALRTPDSVLYAATWEGIPLRWKSPLLMPRWASRLTLEITNVRVERLQDISEEDAQAEGVAPEFEMDAASFVHGAPVVSTYALGFKHAWKDIHGPDSWAENPWVWALTFRVVAP